MAKTDPRVVDRRPCRKCSAEIGFLETSKSRIERAEDPDLAPKMMPVDVKPELRYTAAGEAVWVYTSHFVTCTSAAEVRRDMIEHGKVLPSAKPPAAPARAPGEDDDLELPLGPTDYAFPDPAPAATPEKPPCARCRRKIALGPGLQVCPSCWNLMTPQEQTEFGREPLRIIVCTRGKK